LWLTGLPGAGKSTLAASLRSELVAQGRHVVVLDGDALRTGLNSDLGFSLEDRTENVRRVAEVARLFVDAGFIVVAALVSPSAQHRHDARRIVGKNFSEVFVSAPLATCEQRDPKGMYARARAGKLPDFTGVHASYETPDNPDLVLDTAHLPVDALIRRLADFLKARLENQAIDS
jgi:adenylyl-sulfate kinase